MGIAMMLNDTGDLLWELGQLLGHVRHPRLHRDVRDRLLRARPGGQADGGPHRERRREHARGARRDEPHLPRRPRRRGHPACWSWSTWSRSPSSRPASCQLGRSSDRPTASTSSAGSSSSSSATSCSPRTGWTGCSGTGTPTAGACAAVETLPRSLVGEGRSGPALIATAWARDRSDSGLVAMGQKLANAMEPARARPAVPRRSSCSRTPRVDEERTFGHGVHLTGAHAALSARVLDRPRPARRADRRRARRAPPRADACSASRDLDPLLDDAVARARRGTRPPRATSRASSCPRARTGARSRRSSATASPSLTGPPEMGKTAIARTLGLALATEGWEVHECIRPEQVWDAFDPERAAALRRRRRVRLDRVPARRRRPLGARPRPHPAAPRRAALARLDVAPGAAQGRASAASTASTASSASRSRPRCTSTRRASTSRRRR